MQRISTLLSSCGRGPVVAVAIAAGIALGFGIAAGTHGGSGSATIQPVQNGQEGQEGWGEMDPEAMMEMMAQLNEPGNEHKELAVFVGSWDTKMEALSPGMEAFNSTGSATFESTMGGRFIKQHYNGTMMGSPMTGIGLSGYNKASKKYEGVWHDSMSTALYVVKGDKTGTGWVYEGEETDPMSGETFGYRHVITMDGKDTFSFVMQYPPEIAAGMGVQAEEGQDWVDSFRITYTRKGAGNGMVGNGGNNNQGNNRR
ncbi:MAG: DUF1579 domain-containing protein [Phycisphaera sp.]|nr:MAG: DUF1579 domain-containing protein [Phycisphaera sp.]